MRPSASVLSFTPRDSNHATVSRAEKFLKRRQQRLFPAGIPRGKVAWVEAGMGDIAAAAAGNADFGEELRATFEHRHLGVGRGLGAGDGGKKTRRAAADHNDLSRTHAREFNRASAKVSPKRETFLQQLV